MKRRRFFEHLLTEISLCVGAPVSRYGLWLSLHEHGMDPEGLSRTTALDYCRGPLRDFLAGQGYLLRERPLRRLMRAVARFDADHLTPEERLTRSSA
jgi:hypothetical protein